MARDVKYAKTQFGDIAYTEHGSGPPALLVHGVFLNGYLWRNVIPKLSDLRRCIAVDLLAHGATGVKSGLEVDFTVQAEMLHAFCAALGLDQVDVVANDSGGAIAQIFAARHPARIRTLTLTNCDTHDNWPPPPFQPLVAMARAGRLAERGQRMLADLKIASAAFGPGYEHPEKVTEETWRIYLEPIYGTPERARELERFVASQDCRHTVAVEPLLRKLQAPTLVVWGTDDIFFPTKWAYWLRDTIPGCSKVVEVKDARLFFPEERPDALVEPLCEHWNVASERAPSRSAPNAG